MLLNTMTDVNLGYCLSGDNPPVATSADIIEALTLTDECISTEVYNFAEIARLAVDGLKATNECFEDATRTQFHQTLSEVVRQFHREISPITGVDEQEKEAIFQVGEFLARTNVELDNARDAIGLLRSLEPVEWTFDQSESLDGVLTLLDALSGTLMNGRESMNQ